MGKNELIIERVFKAPCELVWKAWTDSRYQTKWWGPKDFTAPFCKNDLKVGGKYLNCMRSKEGQDFWSTGVYKELLPPIRIVCTDSFADDKGNVVPAAHYGIDENFPLEMEVIIELENTNGNTKMTLHHIGLPKGDMLEMTRQGWNESFEKLDILLSDKTNL